jgi:hypothetical protein
MKTFTTAVLLLLGCLCTAQNADTDYPAAVRVFFADGTDVQLACTPDGNCHAVRGNASSSVTRINLGFKEKHGYVLTVQ